MNHSALAIGAEVEPFVPAAWIVQRTDSRSSPVAEEEPVAAAEDPAVSAPPPVDLEAERRAIRAQIEQEARASGYADGMRNAALETEQALQAKQSELAHAFSRLEQRFKAQINELDQQLADHMTEIILNSVRAIVLHDIGATGDSLRELIRQMLRKIQSPLTQSVLVAHPEDLTLLGEELQMASRADPACARGELRIEHGDGHVEGSLKERLEAGLAHLQATLLLS